MSTETENIFQQPLGFLDLSRRAHDALRSRGITTVGELVRRTRGELVRMVNNFGPITCDGVEVQLKRHKLRLGMSDHVIAEYAFNQGVNLDLSLSIDVLDRAVKTHQRNVLRAAGIKTIGDLLGQTKEDLRAIRGISRETVTRIIEQLVRMKMTLKPSPTPAMKDKLAARVERALDVPVKGIRSVPTPMWHHDCKHCHLIGRVVEHDLYVCDQGGKERDLTLVARYGPRPHETATGPTLLLYLANRPVLRVAIPKEMSP